MNSSPEKTIFQRVRELCLPVGSYVVVGGSMEAHGIRRSRDVDLVVDADLFIALESQGWRPYLPKPEFMGDTWARLERGDVQVNSEISWRGVRFADTSDLIKSAKMIQGIPFAPLEILLEWKKARGRRKDIRDVVLITKFLRGHKD